ncbi:MAG: GNAT family N-acetyltransferase [Spirochaetales bacterium]|nr:GNAT family N-acetyltransferase [Spirochaetales bacterium]
MAKRLADIYFRRMTLLDISGARRLQHLEHWNQNVNDWELFLSANPDGCFVAAAPEQNSETIVGTITSIRYGTQICWISMLLVDPGWRGLGIGKSLMELAIDANVEICDCLCLDATPAGEPIYQKLGFRAGLHLERWFATAVTTTAVTTTAVTTTAVTTDGAAVECDALDVRDLSTILHLDKEAFGADRSPVLTHLIRESPESAWGCGKGSSLDGYILGRTGDRFHHLGPLVARNTHDACYLLTCALPSAAGKSVIIDIVSSRTEFMRWIEAKGFVLQRPFTRMTRGRVPGDQIELITAIAGPEYG